MRKLLSLLTAVLFVGTMWGTPETIFYEDFGEAGNNTSSYSNYNGFSATSSQFTTGTAKSNYTGSGTVGKSTYAAANLSNGYTGASGLSGIYNQSGSEATVITISNIKITGYSNLHLSFGALGGSTSHAITVTCKIDDGAVQTLINSETITNAGWTLKGADISGTGTNLTITIKHIPTKQWIIRVDDIKITGEIAGPEVGVKPATLAWGDQKQNVAPVAKTFKLKGSNLSAALALEASAGYTVDPAAITAADAMEDSVLVTVTPNIPTTTGANNGTITISGGGLASNVVVNTTMTVIATYAVSVTKYALDRNYDEVADLSDFTATVNGGSTVYVVDDEEEINLSATPKAGFEFAGWSVAQADENKAFFTNENAATTTAYASEAVTIIANFTEVDCEPLPAPTLAQAVTVSYNYANIQWNEVTNAVKYIVNVTEHEGDPHITNLNTTSLSTEVLNLKANTQYDYTIQTVGNGTTYCENSNTLEGSFTTTDYPAATLTLSENGVTHTFAGSHKLLDVVTLPDALDDEANAISGKVFKGWDANASCATAPTYAPGAEYTLNAESQTLYAVFATKTGDDEPVLAQTLQYDTWSYSGTTIDKSSYRLFQSGSYIESTNTLDLSILAKVIVYGGTFGGGSYNSLTIGDGTNTWKNVTVSGSSEKGINTYTDGTKLSGTGKLRVTSNSGSGTGDQAKGVRISKVEIFTQIPISYSEYTTTGPKAAYATVSPEQITIVPAGASNTITVTTTNVDVDNLTVAIFNDAECTEAFDGGWLTASINGDNNIAYTASASTSYVSSRSAYIQLTAPAEDEGAADVVVVIPVTQNKKAANFASFAELQASDLPRTTTGTSSVRVTFENIAIDSIKGKNVYIDIRDTEVTTKDIFIYNGSNNAPDFWAVGGLVSGTSLTGAWKQYGGVMEFVITDWTKIAYTAPSFASFEDLVAANLENGDSVIVSFSNIKITATYDGFNGFDINEQSENGNDISIYCEDFEVPDGWAEGGYVSGTEISGKWTLVEEDDPADNYWSFDIASWSGIIYDSTPTAIETVETSEKAVKVLRNGILYIEKNGKTYNAQGQLVK